MLNSIIKYIILFLFLPLLCFSQNPDLTNHPGKIVQSDYYTEIPYESFKGLQIINVSINDEFHRFILDTGAPTSISSDLAKELELPMLGKISVSDANAEKDSIETTVLKSFNIGDIEIENTSMLVLDSDLLPLKCLEIEGLIGSNTFKNSVIQFCQPENVVKISSSIKKLDVKRKDSQKLKLFGAQCNPAFWIKMKNEEKKKIQLFFDSGMRGLLAISLRHYSSLEREKIFDNIKSATGSFSYSLLGITSDTTHYQVTIPTLYIAQQQLRNAPANTTKARNSRIGSEILEYSIVTLDYRNERIYFTPVEENKQDVYKPKFPIDPIYKNGKYKVGIIWDKEKVPNIQLGDEIIFVDGVNCQELGMCELIFHIDNWDKNEIEIITKDKEGNQTTSLITKE